MPVEGDLLVFYEGAFAAAALGTVVLVGRFRTAESASRLRAREISRRTLRAEHEIRRRLSESLHDGPVQELISRGHGARGRQDARPTQGDAARAAELIEEARAVAMRNVHELRDEMLDLGPYAYEEFSFAAAVERCLPVWKRRYDIDGHARRRGARPALRDARASCSASPRRRWRTPRATARPTGST